MSAMTTFMPSPAKRSASASPMPLAAPVTTATRPSKLFTRAPPLSSGDLTALRVSPPRQVGGGPQRGTPLLQGLERPPHGLHAPLRPHRRTLGLLGLPLQGSGVASAPARGPRLLSAQSTRLGGLGRRRLSHDGRLLGSSSRRACPASPWAENARGNGSAEPPEARIGQLVGEPPGSQIGAKTPVGHRGHERAADPAIERGRHGGRRLLQRAAGRAYQRIELGPVVGGGAPQIAPAQLST